MSAYLRAQRDVMAAGLLVILYTLAFVLTLAAKEVPVRVAFCLLAVALALAALKLLNNIKDHCNG